jgi:hypothetical protein
LQILPDDPQLGPFLAGLFVVPGIELETAFDEYRRTFVQVLLRNFGHPAPERHINKGDFLAFDALLVGGNAIDRQSEFDDWRSFRGVTKLDVSRQVSNQKNAI